MDSTVLSRAWDYKSGTISLLAFACNGSVFIDRLQSMQVTMPAGEHENVPMAVSLLARQGSDRFLLDTVLALYSTLQGEDQTTGNQYSALRNGNNDAAELAKEKV